MDYSPKIVSSPVGIGRGRRSRQTPPGTPHPVDAHVGGRLRLRRTLLSMSQERLAAAVGLTFQQVQKYERGANRIGSSRLYQFSHILDVPVSYFFDDMPDDALIGVEHEPTAGLSDQEQSALEDDPMLRQETLELVQAYYRINDTRVRKQVFDLLRAMANLPNEN